MSTPILTFFNNKGGVGKTSLIYHLGWMLSSLGKTVIVADLDPQANLSAAFLSEEQLEEIWEGNQKGSTIYRCVQPLTDVADIDPPVLQKIASQLYLLPGEVTLSSFEDVLSEQWPNSLNDKNLYRPLRILSAFWQVSQMAAKQVNADIVLIDIGPNLGAINRSVLLATDYVIIPVAADLFSLQGLKNLGPTLRSWKKQWQKRVNNWHEEETSKRPDFLLPKGEMKAIGYLCQQHSIRLDRPVKSYTKWLNRIPMIYREYVLNQSSPTVIDKAITPETDSYCLGMIKHYRSLIPMGQESRKPIFSLTSADGAIGAHAHAVQSAKADFRELALKIAEKIGLNTSLGDKPTPCGLSQPNLV